MGWARIGKAWAVGALSAFLIFHWNGVGQISEGSHFCQLLLWELEHGELLLGVPSSFDGRGKGLSPF